MYHSITIGDKNTWDDWHLVADSRPLVNPPSLKTKYVDVPGASGQIDFSTALTGYPLYENRTGSWTFYVMNGYRQWTTRYMEIMEYLHGKTMRCFLEDEPEYYYEGRFTVTSWDSAKDYSKITINYNLEPFKWTKLLSTDDWVWDPFNFETGVIRTKEFRDIEVASDTEWTEKSFAAGLMSRAPVCPIFDVQSTSGNGMTIRFVCSDLGIDMTKNFSDGTTIDPELYFSNNAVKMYFKGKGKVSIIFRSGRL